jgi:hypothetical protein
VKNLKIFFERLQSKEDSDQMNMIVTLKSIKDGFFRCKIKRITGDSYYKEFTASALHNYLTDAAFYCEIKGYNFHWIIPDSIKIKCGQWLESLEKNDTNNSEDA